MLKKSKLKITIFSPYFYPHVGGSEQYAWEIASRLDEYDVTVVSSRFKDEKSQEKIDNFNVVRLENWNLLGDSWPVPKLSGNNINLLADILIDKPDILMTQTRFFVLSLWGILIAKRHKIKLIHVEHGTGHVEMENRVKAWLAKIYDLTFGKWVIKSADMVIGISAAAERFAKNLGARKTEIIYNSIDSNNFEKKNKLKSDKVVRLVFIGRLIYAKGIQDLINTFMRIKGENLSLTIIGDGTYKEILINLAKDDTRIRFVGEKDKNEVIKYLENSDIFVNPSYSEGLPTSVLEAGACGLAVVASDVGGTSEIIENGENGYLVPAKDIVNMREKIIDLIKNPERREKFQVRLNEAVRQKFDWKVNILKVKELIDRI